MTWKISFVGWHNWRWAIRWPFERDALWLEMLPYRGRGWRFLFWHLCEYKPCTCPVKAPAQDSPFPGADSF